MWEFLPFCRRFKNFYLAFSYSQSQFFDGNLLKNKFNFVISIRRSHIFVRYLGTSTCFPLIYPWYINWEGTLSGKPGEQSSRIEVVLFIIEVCMLTYAAKYKLIVINHSCKSKERWKKVPYDSKIT